MSVGSVRQRGQEGRPVLFPQQGLRCITGVRQTQVCLDRVLDLTEKKKRITTTNHTGGPIQSACLYVNIQTIGTSSVVLIL